SFVCFCFSCFSMLGIYRFKSSPTPTPTVITRNWSIRKEYDIYSALYKFKMITELVAMPGVIFKNTVVGMKRASIIPTAIGLYPSVSKKINENILAIIHAEKRCDALKTDFLREG